jgi:hypothetical protein
LVKEEKVLLLALESEDPDQIENAINATVLNCIPDNIKLEDLTIFDLEYIFVKIRAKSVGETSDLTYTCLKEDCEEKTKVKVNFDDIKVINLNESDMRKDLGDQLIIDLKYPSVGDRQKFENIKDEDILVTSVALSIKTIYYKDEIYDTNTISLEEVIEFLGNMNTNQFNPLLASLLSTPHINYDIEWKCKCGEENKIGYNSLADFFI